MRKFDASCLATPAAQEPKQIKQIREAARDSQAVFAHLLNTSVSTVQKWEIGQKRPAGTALRTRPGAPGRPAAQRRPGPAPCPR